MFKKSLFIMGMCGLMACNKANEQAARDADTQQVAEQHVESSEEAHAMGEHTHKEGHGEGAAHDHHNHRFDEPEKYAARWNDPERDTWQHPEEIIAAMGIGAGDHVADIGAGTGYLVAHLSRAVGESGEVVAIDVEQAMVAYLAGRASQLGPAKISPRKVDMDSPALKPATMDGVVTLNTWHHIGGREAYAKKVYEGLKPGKRFVVVDYTLEADPGPPREMRLAPETVAEELKQAGFTVEVIGESMPKHYVVVGQKP